ncbi:MAG: hypothetical protein NT160_02740, partial [Actinobacteria bacterium]|nr:hypothetical protein [Actinomycetota bacterium]
MTEEALALLPASGNFSDHPMELVDKVLGELKAIGEQHGGKLPSQVALNGIIAKGAISIPGAKNLHQAQGDSRCASRKGSDRKATPFSFKLERSLSGTAAGCSTGAAEVARARTLHYVSTA